MKKMIYYVLSMHELMLIWLLKHYNVFVDLNEILEQKYFANYSSILSFLLEFKR